MTENATRKAVRISNWEFLRVLLRVVMKDEILKVRRCTKLPFFQMSGVVVTGGYPTVEQTVYRD